jgi:hypothetical protein
VVGSDTDIPDAAFGNYYLDDSTPVGADQVQCGGDGKSIGSSGFGILGPAIPNTDPRVEGFNSLTVKRTRYFGPPSDGATQAQDFTDRVAKPLGASATNNPVTGGPGHVLKTKLKLSFPGKKAKAVRGKPYRLKVRVANTGSLAANPATVCVRGASLRGKGACVKKVVIGAGRAKTVVVKVRVKPAAKGRKLNLKVTATSKFGKANVGKRLSVGLRR